jgi:hypothetical protein
VKKIILSLLITATIHFVAKAQSLEFHPALSVVMDSVYGKEVLHQCSRNTPQNISKFWIPDSTDISLLENNFNKVYTLYCQKCEKQDLNTDAFQYVGIIIDHEKYIYVNAFHGNITDSATYEQKVSAKKALAKYPIVICDGGPQFWGVLFNIKTKEFSDLQFNGYP